MDADGTVYPARQAGWAALHEGYARSCERHALHCREWLCVAAVGKMLSAGLTVRRYFYAWRDCGLFDAMNMTLVMNLREIEGREASPSAGVIDSESVKTTESGGVCGAARPRAGKTRPGGRRQEDQGSQTPYPDRHMRFSGLHPCPRG